MLYCYNIIVYYVGMPQHGVAVIDAGRLPADHILLVNADLGRQRDGWKKLVNNCLNLCDNRKIKSIAFPALGTGKCTTCCIPQRIIRNVLLIAN